jgi:hypothetical protein
MNTGNEQENPGFLKVDMNFSFLRVSAVKDVSVRQQFI